MASSQKKPAHKRTEGKIWEDREWVVVSGRLVPRPGRPGQPRLFSVLAEKIPFDALDSIEQAMTEANLPTLGVYLAHDSMGYTRYAGRGAVFDRLRNRKKAQKLELQYFSFYIIEKRNHEREIETLIIRSAGPLLTFNDRKKNASILPGNINDYEPGTQFFERQYKRGPR